MFLRQLVRIAKKLNMSLNLVIDTLADKKNLIDLVSLDRYLNEDHVETKVSDLVEDKSEKTIVEVLDFRQDKENIMEILKSLSLLERRVLKMRFGFNNNIENRIA